jgi:hypothetical protein
VSFAFGITNSNESTSAIRWNHTSSGTTSPNGLRKYRVKVITYNSGIINVFLVLINPAANAPAAVAIGVAKPIIASSMLMNMAKYDPIRTEITPKKGPKRNPTIVAEIIPKDMIPVPPTLRLNGISVMTRCSAANTPVSAQGYALDLTNSDTNFCSFEFNVL